jgi:hypothetical protein
VTVDFMVPTFTKNVKVGQPAGQSSGGALRRRLPGLAKAARPGAPGTWRRIL